MKRNPKALDLATVSLHALRHARASQLIRQGMDVVAVSKRLGHGSPSITLTVCAKIFEEAKADTRAADILQAAFARPTQNEEDRRGTCYLSGGNRVANSSFVPKCGLLSSCN